MGQKKYNLSVDQSSKIQSYRQDLDGHLPEELTLCIDDIRSRAEGSFEVQPGEDFVHIGRQSYCFPDLKLKSKETGSIFFCEFFHDWHHYQAGNRIETLSQNNRTDIKIGIAKKLKDKIPQTKSQWFEENGFFFGSFPTGNQVLSVVKKS